MPQTRDTFADGAVSIRIQMIVFNNKLDDLHRALCSAARAAEVGAYVGSVRHVSVRFGDSSPTPVFNDKLFLEWQHEFGNALELSYDFFDHNLGSAGGHNRLAADATADFLLLQNPDAVLSPRALQLLVEPFRRPGPGLVEAKQLPIEHPKDYDIDTGETSWASGACSLIPRRLFNDIGGYDAASFFLYCDDVDLSWRVREAGYSVLFQAAACVFHDKRLSQRGDWQASDPERYYSAEAALLLAHKWSRDDVVQRVLKHYSDHGDSFERRAAVEYNRRKQLNLLPERRDPQHKIGTFIDGNYAKHRYVL